jgi:spore coat polysaccharide biosynthesis predicted glycosyltransferase SpsG
MKVLWYADGSREDGYGHLYRIISIMKLTPPHYENILFYSNDVQKDFYFSKGLNAFDINDGPVHEDGIYLLIDSKKNISDIVAQDSLKKFKGKIILIDSSNMSSINLADTIIFPSFYFDKDLVREIKIKNKKVFFGAKYMIPGVISLRKSLTSTKTIIVSFGGSDPNNLSYKIAKLMHGYDGINFKTKYILGPGYSHDMSLIKRYANDSQIIINPINFDELLASGSLLITALGTTMQKSFLMKIPSIIVDNYEDDSLEHGMILECLNLYYSESFFSFLGHHKALQASELFKEIERLDSLKIDRLFDASELSKGWNSIFKDGL